ncbi:large ribosomal subunit protein mL41 isoform X1 [Periplaneta americana]|uniref:large ribosomal subunit protein mL41 isoform X1 n=1 Tax=Periplaneta americana TaxID=6978 RepID=UPI0037E92189
MAVSRYSLEICRGISTTIVCHGKRNFRKFPLYNKRGTKLFKKEQSENPDPDLFHDLGVRPTGYKRGDTFVEVPEMIPELVVPDLTGFKLKPYVSYRVQDVIQSEFTPKDLFDAVYSEKIVNDFKNGKLDESGEPLEPSPEEQLKPEEAFLQARKTGTDIFQ